MLCARAHVYIKTICSKPYYLVRWCDTLCDFVEYRSAAPNSRFRPEELTASFFCTAFTRCNQSIFQLVSSNYNQRIYKSYW